MRKIVPGCLLIILASITFLMISCEINNEEPDITANNLKGMFVVCEGNYGTADGDITYYNTSDSTTVKSLYYSANSTEIGDVVQAFAIADTLGFIVVNNSQKVTVVNMKDFSVIKTLDGFSYPRSIIRADENTMYVTNGNGFSGNCIYSIDLETLEKSDTLEISKGLESIISVGSKAYVAVSGGWNNDGNTVIEIDPGTFSIVKTYNVASCPVDLVSDKDKNIWVYCKGMPDYSGYPEVSYTGMGICKINVSTDNVSTFSFSSMSSPGIYNITVSRDGSTIYYLNGGLYAMSASDAILPSASMIGQSFYGVDVDPQTGNIICLDAVNSKAVAYNSAGSLQFDFETSRFPVSVIFSY